MPHLHHGARKRRAVLVDHAHADVDELADGALLALAGEIAAHRREAPRQLARAGELGEAVLSARERLRRPAPGGLDVSLHHALGLGARITRRYGIRSGIGRWGHIVDTVNDIR